MLIDRDMPCARHFSLGNAIMNFVIKITLTHCQWPNRSKNAMNMAILTDENLAGYFHKCSSFYSIPKFKQNICNWFRSVRRASISLAEYSYSYS